MATVEVKDMSGNKVSDLELSDDVFGIKPNKPAMHLAVRVYLTNQRQGTQSTLTRAEVRGGGKKPWRQKGTGHARQGSTRAPQWRTGGVVFAPKPRDFRMAMPRKVRALALKGALTAKVSANQFIVVEDLALSAPKTKEMVKALAALGIDTRALVVVRERDETVFRASHNIPNVDLTLCNTLNVLDILTCDKMLLTRDAVARIEEVYA